MRGVVASLVAVVAILSVTLAPSVASGTGSSPPSSPTLFSGFGASVTPAGSAPLAGTPTPDLTVSASNVTTLAGISVNFTATIAGVAPAQTTWWWGDGTTSTVTSNPSTHTYANPGIYLVYALATDASGGLHDNLGSLLRFAVLNSYSNDALGNEAQVQGNIVANASTTAAAQAVIAPGGWIQVSNWVTDLPTNPQWTLGTPSYVVGASAQPYVNISTILGLGLNLSAATLSWSNSTPQGSYTLNYSVPDSNPYVTSSGTTWNNYTFTMFVSPAAATPVLPLPVSPHNGTLDVYQLNQAWGGNMTLDPALADDAMDGPIIQNFYQTLIVYNGSQAGPAPSDFVPDLATCVPGSSQCVRMYGSSLVSGNNWTFVINPNATFYNGTTGATSSVYPNDVAFSFARSCLLVNPGSWGVENFVLCQALLPYGWNVSWDGGLHAPYNTTPANILDSMSVNSSAYCTPAMENGLLGHGCLTLDTTASGKAWPEFLEFVESTDGWAIVSCSWAASVGLGLPDWTNGTTCYPAPPGSAGNPNPVPSETAWDGYEVANRAVGSVLPNNALRYHALGSGPYYLATFDNATGYTLRANPDWGGTTCVGGRLDGCLPSATKGGHLPSYIPTVEATFESSMTPGLAALAAGKADLVDMTLPSNGLGNPIGNASAILAEVRSGVLDYVVGPAVTVDLTGFDLVFNQSAASSLQGSSVSLPANALEDLNFRQFLIASYPYVTSESDDCLADGILYCFNFGGAIPVGMGGYYPTNISWPLTNPNLNPSDVGSAAWWWAQVASDPMVGASCTPKSPCTFPLPSVGLPDYAVLGSWAQTIRTLSQGAIQATLVNMTWRQADLDTYYQPAGNATFPITEPLGWAPDYFDPSDYAMPYYNPESVFYQESFAGDNVYFAQYNRTCAGPASDPTVTTGCQGSAYEQMLSLLQNANTCAAPTCTQVQRELLYNMAERIADGLGLYLNVDQQSAVYGFAPWIDASSLLLNPDRNNVYGGVTSDQPFFFIEYASAIPQGYQLEVQLNSPGTGTSGSTGPSSFRVSVQASGAGRWTLEVGEPFLALVSVSGGTGIYRYIWNGLPTGCASVDAAVLTCRPGAAGNFSWGVTVVDSLGDTGISNAISMSVAPHVAITQFLASPSNVTLGEAVQFTLSAGGGIGTLTDAYLGLPSGCSSTNASRLNCTPTAVGHYSVTARVTDSLGFQAFASLELNVSSTPSPAPAPARTSSAGWSTGEWYGLLTALVIAAVAVGAAWAYRRRQDRTPKPEEGGGASSSAPAAAGMVTCSRCGAANRAGAKFCDQCASSLPP